MPRQSPAAVPIPLPPRQRSCASLPERRGTLGLLFTGKVILERGKEVPDDRDAPRSSQQLLASPAAYVGDVRVVEGEAEDPAEQRQERGKVRFGSCPAPLVPTSRGQDAASLCPIPTSSPQLPRASACVLQSRSAEASDC